MRSHLGTKVVAGFAIAVALLMVVDAVAFRSLNRLIDTGRAQMRAYEVLDDLDDLLGLLQNAETGQRGFLLTGDDAYLEPYHAAAPAAAADLDELRALTAHDPAHARRLERLEPLVDEKLAELRETIDRRRGAGLDAALSVVRTHEGKRVMDQIRALVAEMKAAEQATLAQRQQAAAAGGRSAIGVILAGSLLGTGLLFTALALIWRDQRRRAAAAAALRSAHDALEARVVERTAELGLANQQLRAEVEQRTRAEARLEGALAQLSSSRDDVVSILDRLDLAVALLERDGRVVFLSRAAAARLGRPASQAAAARWDELLPFDAATRARLGRLIAEPQPDRERVATRVELADGRRLWVEVEVRDDPRDPTRTVLFFNDVTEVYDLRRQVEERMELHDMVGRFTAARCSPSGSAASPTAPGPSCGNGHQRSAVQANLEAGTGPVPFSHSAVSAPRCFAIGVALL